MIREITDADTVVLWVLEAVEVCDILALEVAVVDLVLEIEELAVLDNEVVRDVDADDVFVEVAVDVAVVPVEDKVLVAEEDRVDDPVLLADDVWEEDNVLLAVAETVLV